MDDRKSSTMNSMYIGSVIQKPNVDSIINAVSTILHSQMLEVRSNNVTGQSNQMIIGLRTGKIDTTR